MSFRQAPHRRQRRAVLQALAVLALGGSCSRDRQREQKRSSAGPASPPWHDLRFDEDVRGPEQRALVHAVTGRGTAPVVVALHGRGEAGRGLEAGAFGFRDDYGLGHALERVAAPPLTLEDLLGMVSEEQLGRYNASLVANPYAGLTIACPYTPVPSEPDASERFARFVIDRLLPRVDQLQAEKAGRHRTGIDGISMGGRYALEIGLAHPDVFASVGAMQPAIGDEDVERLADLAARSSSAQLQGLRLASSDEDPFLGATRALSAALEKRGVAHRLVVTRGPHDYAWNRGPGVFELVLHHERKLRNLAEI